MNILGHINLVHSSSVRNGVSRGARFIATTDQQL